MLMGYCQDNDAFGSNDIEHFVWESVEDESSDRFNLDLPCERLLKNSYGGSLRLIQKLQAKAALLSLVIMFCFQHFGLSKLGKDQFHYKSRNASCIETHSNRPSS